jgi:hypothetical protein
MTTTTKRGGPGRNQGRKPKHPGEPMEQHSVRWTAQQWSDALFIGLDRMRELVTAEAKRQRETPK